MSRIRQNLIALVKEASEPSMPHCDIQESLNGSSIPGDVRFYSDGKDRATAMLGDWHDPEVWELVKQFGPANWKDWEMPDDSEIGMPDWATCSLSNEDPPREKSAMDDCPCSEGANLSSPSNTYICRCYKNPMIKSVGWMKSAGRLQKMRERRGECVQCGKTPKKCACKHKVDGWVGPADEYPEGDPSPPPSVEVAKEAAEESSSEPSAEVLMDRPCCGMGCKNCPYEPAHQLGNTNLKAKYKNPEKKAAAMRSMMLTGRAYKTPTTVSETPRFVTPSELRRIALTGQTYLSKLAAITNVGRDQELEEETGPDDLKAALRKARKDTDSHATDDERKAGNYKKGRISIRGLHIAIENPANSIRSGTDGSGRKWRSVLSRDYGYFTRGGGKDAAPIAVDGDEIDVFIGPNLESDFVVVIDQYFGGKFDESKFVICCRDKEHGKSIYMANYQDGWKCGPVSTCTLDQLKEWLKDGDHEKPFKGQLVKAAGLGIISP